MRDISRDTPADGSANGPASGEQFTGHEVNLPGMRPLQP